MAVVRRGLFVRFLIIAACMAVMPTAPAHAQAGGTPVVVLDGKGWGHGVGLSQWGAKYMADAGAAHDQILSTFYPGTTLADDGGSTVRVSVYTAPDGRSTLTFPNGGEVRSSPGGDQAFAFGGISGDVPMVGDWNGTGTSKVGVFRSGFFWVLDANGNHTFDGTRRAADVLASPLFTAAI